MRSLSARTASWLSWSLACLSLSMFVAGVVLYFLGRSVQSSDQWVTLERAEELGGRCEVEPDPEGGTRVLARLPLPPQRSVLKERVGTDARQPF